MTATIYESKDNFITIGHRGYDFYMLAECLLIDGYDLEINRNVWIDMTYIKIPVDDLCRCLANLTRHAKNDFDEEFLLEIG